MVAVAAVEDQEAQVAEAVTVVEEEVQVEAGVHLPIGKAAGRPVNTENKNEEYLQ